MSYCEGWEFEGDGGAGVMETKARERESKLPFGEELWDKSLSLVV